MKLMSDYENSVKKVASNKKNHLRFNLHCKHNGVVLSSLHMHTVVEGKNVDTTTKNTERESAAGGKNWSDSEKSEEFGGKD